MDPYSVKQEGDPALAFPNGGVIVEDNSGSFSPSYNDQDHDQARRQATGIAPHKLNSSMWNGWSNGQGNNSADQYSGAAGYSNSTDSGYNYPDDSGGHSQAVMPYYSNDGQQVQRGQADSAAGFAGIVHQALEDPNFVDGLSEFATALKLLQAARRKIPADTFNALVSIGASSTGGARQGGAPNNMAPVVQRLSGAFAAPAGGVTRLQHGGGVLSPVSLPDSNNGHGTARNSDDLTFTPTISTPSETESFSNSTNNLSNTRSKGKNCNGSEGQKIGRRGAQVSPVTSPNHRNTVAPPPAPRRKRSPSAACLFCSSTMSEAKLLVHLKSCLLKAEIDAIYSRGSRAMKTFLDLLFDKLLDWCKLAMRKPEDVTADVDRITAWLHYGLEQRKRSGATTRTHVSPPTATVNPASQGENPKTSNLRRGGRRSRGVVKSMTSPYKDEDPDFEMLASPTRKSRKRGPRQKVYEEALDEKQTSTGGQDKGNLEKSGPTTTDTAKATEDPDDASESALPKVTAAQCQEMLVLSPRQLQVSTVAVAAGADSDASDGQPLNDFFHKRASRLKASSMSPKGASAPTGAVRVKQEPGVSYHSVPRMAGNSNDVVMIVLSSDDHDDVETVTYETETITPSKSDPGPSTSSSSGGAGSGSSLPRKRTKSRRTGQAIGVERARQYQANGDPMKLRYSLTPSDEDEFSRSNSEASHDEETRAK